MKRGLFKILGIEIRTEKNNEGQIHYSVRLGNTTKGFYYMTDSLRRLTIFELENLLEELKEK